VVTLVALAASVTESAGAVQVTVTVPEVAWGEVPSIAPTTASNEAEVAPPANRTTEHVCPFPQYCQT
jgi:hypothetical protein